MKQIDYRTMRPGEEQLVCDVVGKVFYECIAQEYESEGLQEFFRFADPDRMRERMQSGGLVLVASHDESLVGMLELVPPDRLALFFVRDRGRGIGRELLARAISRIRAAVPAAQRLTVHSSRYAEPAYRRLGFYRVGDVRTDHGITYVPMELAL